MPLDSVLATMHSFKDFDPEQTLQVAMQFLQTAEGTSVSIGVVASAVAAVIDRYAQQREADVFPVIYSRFPERGNESATGQFYAAVNDFVMGVAELWNATRKEGYDQLSMRLASSPLGSACYKVSRESSRMESLLAKHQEVATQAAQSAERFGQSWTYTSHDNYHTEFYTTTSSDGKGNTTTQYHTRQVYDDTDHYFHRHFDKAVEGKRMTDDLIQAHPPAELYTPDLDKIRIEADAQDIARIRDTLYEDPKKEVLQEEADSKLNAWTRAAIVGKNIPAANKLLDEVLTKKEDLFKRVQESRDNYHYNTTSRSHPGPEGYQAAMLLRDQLGSVASDIRTVLETIALARGNAENLTALLQQPMESEKRQGRKIMREALDFAVDTYLANFPESEIKFDQRTRPGKTALIALGCGVGAGLAAYGLQYWLQQ
jgi:hypothetical protein